MAIRILIADDHGLIRDGLRSLLSSEPGMEVVGEATDGYEALNLSKALVPDIVLMDISMPGMGGIEATRQMRESLLETRVLFLTVHEDHSLLQEALRVGASGFIIKRAVRLELVTAIQAVQRGEIYIHPAMMHGLVKDLTPLSPIKTVEVEALTPREVDVLRLLAGGLTNRQIGERLGISRRTVEGYRASLMNKLNLHSRMDLVNYAEGHGLLETKKAGS
ncbi:MAG TPA: response regulator transcription factor [Anaerolineales bacterium]|nr:response regulator transcription factor [Anaerolineales bacterium]